MDSSWGEGVVCRGHRWPVRCASMALWFSAGALAACAASPKAVCVSPVQSVDQVDSGVALLVGPGPDDFAWSRAEGLREGMVLSGGVPSEVCRGRYQDRLERLRQGLERKFGISE